VLFHLLAEDETAIKTRTTKTLSISESQVVFWPSDPEERSSSVQLTCTSLVKLIHYYCVNIVKIDSNFRDPVSVTYCKIVYLSLF